MEEHLFDAHCWEAIRAKNSFKGQQPNLFSLDSNIFHLWWTSLYRFILSFLSTANFRAHSTCCPEWHNYFWKRRHNRRWGREAYSNETYIRLDHKMSVVFNSFFFLWFTLHHLNPTDVPHPSPPLPPQSRPPNIDYSRKYGGCIEGTMFTTGPLPEIVW